MFLPLALVLSSGCKDEADKLPPVAKKKVAVVPNPEDAQDRTKLPHEAVNDLLLTAEVLDQEKWIVGLTWENVGDTTLTIPMAGYLKEDIRKAYTNPFFSPLYTKPGIVLSHGKHTDSTILDFSRHENYGKNGSYMVLRDLWGGGGSLRESLFYNQIDQFMRLRSGEKVTCFFRYPRIKDEDESVPWKEGDQIPIDFSYAVGNEISGGNRVSLTSGKNGQAIEHQPPSPWHGKVFSNVVYLKWNSAGERVRWPNTIS